MATLLTVLSTCCGLPRALVQVFLRITGTAAGGTVGWAALHATTSPFLLLLIMCTAGMLIAPLASASLHFRCGGGPACVQGWVGCMSKSGCCHGVCLCAAVTAMAWCRAEPCSAMGWPSVGCGADGGCLVPMALFAWASDAIFHIERGLPAAPVCRFATALTVISMLVVVLCQFDPDSGESRATDAFYGTRLLEVRALWGCCRVEQQHYTHKPGQGCHASSAL